MRCSEKRAVVHRTAPNRLLEAGHIYPKRPGGSNRLGNLAPACLACNDAKKVKTMDQLLTDKPDLVGKIRQRAAATLDALPVDSGRLVLCHCLKTTIERPITTSSRGRAGRNHREMCLPRHCSLDTAGVGQVSTLKEWRQPIVSIRNGRHPLSKVLHRFPLPVHHQVVRDTCR